MPPTNPAREQPHAPDLEPPVGPAAPLAQADAQPLAEAHGEPLARQLDPAPFVPGLLTALPIHARSARVYKPMGTEALFQAIEMRLAEIGPMLRNAIPVADGELRVLLEELQALL